MDHLEVYVQYKCKQPITLNSRIDFVSKGLIGGRWMINGTGLGATNHFESGAFIRSRAGVKWPDIQFHFLPAAMRYDGKAAFNGHGFQVHVGPNKPRSRGVVRVISPSADDKPAIRFNYLQHEDDRADWRTTIRLTREILMQPALDSYRGEEIQPGKAVARDDEIDSWVRETTESAYHPCGTCKMGADEDPLAVLDSACRLRGIGRVRVVDASVFPTITNGNLNAPTIMVAERLADIILGQDLLAPADVEVWIDPQWRQRQRTGQPEREVSVEKKLQVESSFE
jgi:choline dehydrogenase